MQKKVHLTRRSQYKLVYSRGKSWTNRLLVMRALPNDLICTRYGLSVGKRVGNAVTRNRVKRLLRENIRLIESKPGWDVVFIARDAASGNNYHNIGNAVKDLLHRSHLLIEERDKQVLKKEQTS